MKISIVGWYGEKNAGDDAFKCAFIQEWGKKHKLSFAQKPDLQADLIVYGGGGVAVNHYLDHLPKDREAIALGVDIPVNGPNWGRLRSYSFKKIYVRSKEYAFIARRNGLSQVEYCPDLAFALEHDPKPLSTSGKKLGIILTPEFPTTHYAEMAYALSELGKCYSLHFIEMYAGKVSDMSILHQVKNLLSNGVVCHRYSGYPRDTLSLIGAMDFLITMRFHGAIFSTIAAIPFLSVAYPGKHSLFCEQSRLKPCYTSLGEISGYKFLSLIEGVNNAHRIGNHLKDLATQNRKEVKDILALYG